MEDSSGAAGASLASCSSPWAEWDVPHGGHAGRGPLVEG